MFLKKPYIQVRKFPDDSDQMVQPGSLVSQTKGKYWNIYEHIKKLTKKEIGNKNNNNNNKVVDLQGSSSKSCT